MVIKREDFNFLEGESVIKDEEVFLETAEKPSKRYPDGIPKGILILTNKRLFFLNTGIGTAPPSYGRLVARNLPNIVGAMVPAPGVLELAKSAAFEIADYAIEKSSRKPADNEDIEQLLQRKESFVILLERIISCKKFGGIWSIRTKHRYATFEVVGDLGTRISYCIYAHNPRGGEEEPIYYWKWYDAIRKTARYS